MERRGEGAVRCTGNQSLSNFRFRAEKTAEHTWPPPPCAAVFIAAPRPPAALCPTAAQTHRKIHGYSQPPVDSSKLLFFCARVAKRSRCPYEMGVISVRNKSWEVHHLLCSLRETHRRSISLTTAGWTGWFCSCFTASNYKSDILENIRNYSNLSMRWNSSFLFYFFSPFPRFSGKLHPPG